jgi:small GTP-binding protein
MGGAESHPAKKLIFLGLDNAGKTSIVNSLTGASPYAVMPTRGFNLREKELGSTFFQIFDVGGQKSLRNHWSDYFTGADGIVWVVDSADHRRLYETGLELAALLSDNRTKGVPVLILANKQDLSTAMLPADIAIELELSNIRDRNWYIQGCSAIRRDPVKMGIENGIKWMITEIVPQPKK